MAIIPPSPFHENPDSFDPAQEMIHLQAKAQPKLRFLEVDCMKSTFFCGSMQKALKEHNHFQRLWNQEDSINQQFLKRKKRYF
jgi:hypothetical protein